MIQNSKCLRDLRQQWSKGASEKSSQETLAATLSEIVRNLQPIKNGYLITQSKLSRWESGRASPGILELLAYAHFFDVELASLLNPAYHTLCRPEMEVISCTTKTESENCLCDLESGGRFLVFSRFPSPVFSPEATQNRRFEQISNQSLEDIEYYTIDSYLQFLFSPIGHYTLSQKININDLYINIFNEDNPKKHIRFFSLPNANNHFSDFELLHHGKTLIMLAPLLLQEGDVFIKLRNEEICKQVNELYAHKMKKLSANTTLLRLGKKALEKLNDGIPIGEAINHFYLSLERSHPQDIESVSNILHYNIG
ncbi:helix-turn-helix transcriptional regulator [Thiothrix sp.]|jgi:transcriptional regulator with XRE-family HTH domain|uniref:helix-turn-helix domain-containing protein n=1 Tax=Thiothrix sp. TaxID=1032 RepID=UPI00257E8DBF|nr:helix-turn-helix transcriptional regulator [Thiothrix sp.]